MIICKKINCKKWLSGMLAAAMLLSVSAVLTGCAESNEPAGESAADAFTAGPSDSAVSGIVESETAAPDTRFENINYNDRSFRIYTSTNAASAGMGNSNFMIEGEEELDGGLVNNAVHERNIKVEELLGVKLEFTGVDLGHASVAGDIRTLTQAGDDEFDLVINDLYAFSQLTIEGHFRNTLNEDCVFDFDRPYWYKDYMADLRLMNGHQTLLAGDYFIDVIRSAHLLLLNKGIYEDFYQKNPDEIYDLVTNMEWTYEKLNEIISGVYLDENSNGSRDKGDMFGFISCSYWGGSIPFTISGDPSFISRDEDGIPTSTLGAGDRSNQLASAMSTLFNNECSSIGQTEESVMLEAFAHNECMVMNYQRLGSLENEILRGMEGDACVLPYPMLFASDQKYTTSTHDTTEVGAILKTSTDMAFISTVIEVLNRETAAILMPKYYKEGLQVQYVDDSKAAQMIDIIHDNFDNSFALAYNSALGNVILQAFQTAIESKREFSAVYAKKDMVVNRTLEKKIKQFMENNTDN